MPDPNRPRADFSKVTGGSSSTAPDDAPIAPPEQRTHVVERGESLSKIAKRYYGDAKQWRIIFDANRDKIANPDLIHPGQEFVIPDIPGQ